MKLSPIIVFLGITAAVIAAIIAFFAIGGPALPTPSPTPVVQEIPIGLLPSIQVFDQVATSSATVNKVTLTEGGYVVIHEAAADGTPGGVIGYTNYLAPGSYNNLQVPLTRNVKLGENLFAMLHGDDGDQTYGFPDEDLPLKDAAGKPILKKFTSASP